MLIACHSIENNKIGRFGPWTFISYALHSSLTCREVLGKQFKLNCHLKYNLHACVLNKQWREVKKNFRIQLGFMISAPPTTYLALLYSNSMWRQSSMPTSIFRELFISGKWLSVCTATSSSLMMSERRRVITTRRKYLVCVCVSVCVNVKSEGV